LAELGIVLVPQNERMSHGIRPDPELQGAAISHRARDVKADRMLAQIDRLARRREQGKIGLRTFEQKRELLRRQIGVSGHERQLGIDLADQYEICFPARACCEQIERDIGIAAETQPRSAAALFLGHDLRHHIDAAREHITACVRVVGADIALLGAGNSKPRAGLKEELVDHHVGRKPALALGGSVGQIGVAAEHAVRERPCKSGAELRASARLLQCQRGEDAQVERAVRLRAREQGIGDVVRFAEAKRQPEHDVLADASNDRIGETVGVGEASGAGAAQGSVSYFEFLGLRGVAVKRNAQAMFEREAYFRQAASSAGFRVGIFLSSAESRFSSVAKS